MSRRTDCGGISSSADSETLGLSSRAPKEAVEHALWVARKPRSSAVYERLAEAVSLAG